MKTPFVQTDRIAGIIGRDEFLKMNENDDFDSKENIALIAIHEPDSDIHNLDIVKDFGCFLQMQFWDVEEPIGNYEPLTPEQGEEIREFILDNADMKFLIHCRAGVSRSAGVGLAVECLLDHNGDKFSYGTSPSAIKDHWRYQPNRTVFDMIVG